MAIFGHILRRGLTSLVENAYLNAVSSGVIAAALGMLATFLLVFVNVQGALERWSQDVHLSAYLDETIEVDARESLRAQVAALPEVESAKLVTEAQARADMEGWLPDMAEVLAVLDDDVLPASLEITLGAAHSDPEAVEAFVAGLGERGLHDVDYGQEWVQRFGSFMSLIQFLGVLLAALVSAAAVFLVGNTMHLVAYTRRAELETLKLVGGTWSFVSLPFVIEGTVQGVVGAAVAVLSVFALHQFVSLQLEAELDLGLLGELSFLPPLWMGVLILVGVGLGASGSLLSVYRFWRAAP